MTEPVYRLRNVVKGYEGRQVLNIQSLDILTGEIFAVVGPSGAGKSTLLRLLNFLEMPSSDVGPSFSPGSWFNCASATKPGAVPAVVPARERGLLSGRRDAHPLWRGHETAQPHPPPVCGTFRFL